MPCYERGHSRSAHTSRVLCLNMGHADDIIMTLSAEIECGQGTCSRCPLISNVLGTVVGGFDNESRWEPSLQAECTS